VQVSCKQVIVHEAWYSHYTWIPLLGHFKKPGARLSLIMLPAPLVIGTRRSRNLRGLRQTILSSRLLHLTCHTHRRRREMSRCQIRHGRPVHLLVILQLLTCGLLAQLLSFCCWLSCWLV